MAGPKWPHDHAAKHRAAAKKGWEHRRGGTKASAKPAQKRKPGHDAKMKAYASAYNLAAARFVTDVHGENRRRTYRDATELRHHVYDLKREAERRLYAGLDREDSAKTPKEAASARRSIKRAKGQIKQADALWNTVYDLGAAARNNPETTQRWLGRYKRRG